ncbi:MAG: YbjQ family protein [Xanthomonadales bacterium]|nr:YbjQ family protein [Xanthomonadales bacterium]MCB1633463.1 YbjQ family protein [Xanthomonadales bacterium]MCB1640575.1 YbjQ family protein [Xanthomonadales bacterium]
MELIVGLTLLVIGVIFGQLNERSHYRDIERREKLYRRILVLPERFVPEAIQADDTRLVTGSVVIASDYFKRVAAGFRQLIGGRMGMYETLLDRARREAILRMKEQAFRCGANTVCNVKIQTSSISQGAKGEIGSVEVLAYGTAVRPGTVKQSG